MAIELITGRAGTPHVDSFDVGAFQSTMFGKGAYVLEGVEAELADANTVTIHAGELLCEGRHIRVTGAGDSLTIENGLSAYKRHDIVAIKYLRDEDGIETTELVVIKGTPEIDNPSDPEMPTVGKLLENATEVYWPLYRIVINGLTPQTPVLIAQRQDVYILGLGEEIPSGADFNDYTEPGIYYIRNNVIAAEVVNTPSAAFGLLTVRLISPRLDDAYITQDYTVGSSMEHYSRTWDAGAKKWTSWYCYGGIDSIVSQSAPGSMPRWRKWSSGKAEVWWGGGPNPNPLPYGTFSAIGNVFVGTYRKIAYPFEFVEPPVITAFLYRDTGNDLMCLRAKERSTKDALIIAFAATNAGNVYGSMYYYAEGMWK